MTPQEHGSEAHSNRSSRASEQLREQAGQLADDVRELGKTAKELAREKVEAARRAGDEIYEGGLQRARACEDQIIDYVRANPIKSLLIAAAAGLLIGSMSRR